MLDVPVKYACALLDRENRGCRTLEQPRDGALVQHPG